MRHRLSPGIIFLLAFFSVIPAAGQDCFGDTFCVFSEQRGDTINVFVDNKRPADVSVRFKATRTNLIPTVPLPYSASFPGNRRTRAFSLIVADRGASWSYKFDLRWLFGSMTARHDDRYVYELPYAAGTEHLVGQGYNGAFSHRGINAIDWNMPEGTPIYAAREGVVVDLEDQYARGGTDEQLKEKANFVMIRHPDGTIGNYVHLMRGGARVQRGQRIRQGQLLGLSGNTGYTTGPHLHFEVFKIGRDLKRKTIPVRFAVRGHPEGITLKEGETYRQ